MKLFLFSCIIAAALLTHVSAVIITDESTANPGLPIPDGSTIGVASTQNFVSDITLITEVRVSLDIVGTPDPGDAINGDIYAYITHGSGFAVLLNRVGRTASNDDGYADSGFSVTFDDSPAGNDIHNYRLFAPITSGPLTGVWGSDARNVNPAGVLDTTPRTASLTSFNESNPNGAWTVFVADVSPGGTAKLVSWRIQLTGDTVPEPGSTVLLLGGLVTLGLRRRRAA